MIVFIFDGGIHALHRANVGSLGAWRGREVNGQLFGAFHALNAGHRDVVTKHHADLHALPGINGTLTKEQAKVVSKTITSACEGMSMRDLLREIHAITEMSLFDPNAY